jgi:hypothetical protein
MGAQRGFGPFQQPWENEIVRCRQQQKLASRSRQAGPNRNVGTTVDVVLDQSNAIVLPAEICNDLETIIGRTIIDEQDFHRRDRL